jgi:hypothetical protein
MSHVTRTEWYERVNATWPRPIPQLTAEEAIRAAKRLYRFGMKRTWRGPVRVTSGNRYTWIRRGEMVVNPSHGWHGLVHLLSHYCHHRNSTVFDKPHGRKHAQLEIRMIKEAIKRGWLDGKLKSEPKVKAKPPTPNDKLERLRLREKRWITRTKRAATALKKIRRAITRLEKIQP